MATVEGLFYVRVSCRTALERATSGAVIGIYASCNRAVLGCASGTRKGTGGVAIEKVIDVRDDST